MHPPAPLPYADLTDTQWQLLGELATASLPDPAAPGGTADELVARGLDPGQVGVDLPTLTWLKYVEQRDGRWTASDLGTAVHYRARCESLQKLLSDIARFAADPEVSQGPDFARVVGRLARGEVSVAKARTELHGREQA